jgi:hypothetical protein
MAALSCLFGLCSLPLMGSARGAAVAVHLVINRAAPAAAVPMSALPPNRATLDQVEAAIKAIEDDCGIDESSCVSRLLEAWKRDRYYHVDFVRRACERAGGATIPLILDQVEEALAPGAADAEVQRGVVRFFGEPARLLSKKLRDPERILQLAVRSGGWSTIATIECSQQLRDKYVVEGLASCQRLRWGLGLVSVSGVVSKEVKPQLREVVRRLAIEAPNSDGLAIPLRTLVEWDDTAMTPDLERIIQDKRLSADRQSDFELYLAKLRLQHDKQALLSIVRQERENAKVLRWAVARLLWLNTPKKLVFEALAANRRPSRTGHDIAGELNALLRAVESGEASPIDAVRSEPLAMDAQEFEGHFAALKAAGDLGAAAPLTRKLTFRSLLASAPSGD